MLRLLRTVSWRDYRAAWGRLALMIGGIAVGVALIAALGIVNENVLRYFSETLVQAAGEAQLQIELGTGEIGFDQAIATQLADHPDVKIAIPLVRGTLHEAAERGGGAILQLYGIDLLDEASTSYQVERTDEQTDHLATLNDRDAVFLTEQYARRRGVALGDRLPFAVPTGIARLHVRGLLKATGLAKVFGEDLAIMDLENAQRVLGKDGRIDQIDVIVSDDCQKTPDALALCRERLRQALPPTLAVNYPAFRGERFGQTIGAFQEVLNGLSLLCLLAGVFIVYNTVATAITERARDLAVLLTLGAERRRIFNLVLIESAVIGTVASLVGIVLGIGLAYILTGLVVRSMGAIYQLNVSVDSLTIPSFAQLAFCFAMGTGGSIAAAFIPARRAARLDPIELMRADYRSRLGVTSSNRLLVVVGVLLLVATVAAVWIEESLRWIALGNVAATLWYVTALVLSIPAMSLIARGLRDVLPRTFGLGGRIASEGLLRAPARTGVTAAVIGLSLTVAVAVSTIAKSMQESFENWFIITGELVVSGIGTEGEGAWLESPLSIDVGRIIKDQVPGVERVETYRVLQGQEFDPATSNRAGDDRVGRIALVGVSAGFLDETNLAKSLDRAQVDDALRAIRSDDGNEVLISDNLAERFDLDRGDAITLPSPTGPVPLRVNAIITADFSGDQGAVIMNRTKLARGWLDSQVSHFNVFLGNWVPGEHNAERVEAAKQAIKAALRGTYDVKVLNIAEALAYHRDKISQAFKFTYAIQLLVVVVTLAGIVDLLTTQIIERRREIGVLRIVGATQDLLARSIWLEALIIGLSGAALGIIISVGTSRLWVHVNFRILIGYIAEHHFAYLTAAACVILAGGFAALAGWVAARRALRESVLDAIRYE